MENNKKYYGNILIRLKYCPSVDENAQSWSFYNCPLKIRGFLRALENVIRHPIEIKYNGEENGLEIYVLSTNDEREEISKRIMFTFNLFTKSSYDNLLLDLKRDSEYTLLNKDDSNTNFMHLFDSSFLINNMLKCEFRGNYNSSLGTYEVEGQALSTCYSNFFYHDQVKFKSFFFKANSDEKTSDFDGNIVDVNDYIMHSDITVSRSVKCSVMPDTLDPFFKMPVEDLIDDLTMEEYFSFVSVDKTVKYVVHYASFSPTVRVYSIPNNWDKSSSLYKLGYQEISLNDLDSYPSIKRIVEQGIQLKK